MDPNQTPLPPQQPQQPTSTPQPVVMPQAPGQAFAQPAMQQPMPSAPVQMPQMPQAGQMPQPAPTPNQFGGQYQPAASQPLPSNKSKTKLIVIGAAAAVVIIGAVAFFALGGAKDVVNKVTGGGLELESYSNPNFAFSFQAPKGWTVDESNEEYSKYVSFEEPVGDIKDTSEAGLNTAYIRVGYNVATSEYQEKSEQEYFDYTKRLLQRIIAEEEEPIAGSESVPEKYTLESEGATTVGGYKAYKVKFKVNNYRYEKDAVGYNYGLFVFIDNKTQYELQISGHESEGIHSKADAIMNSFTRN